MAQGFIGSFMVAMAGYWGLLFANILSSLMALFLLVFAWKNASWDRSQKAADQMFGFEMDKVMGGLMGIGRYSKVEAVVLFLAGTGIVGCWWPKAVLYCVLGFILAILYLCICYAYAIYAR